MVSRLLTGGRATWRHSAAGRDLAIGRGPFINPARFLGDVAQLGEHLLCKQGVVGSSPIVSIAARPVKLGDLGLELF